MNFKVTLTYLASFMLASLLLISCGDDNSSGTEQTEAPSVEAPAALSGTVDEPVEITFTITASAGYASSSLSAENGNATIISEPSTGETSGSVVVEFTPTAIGTGTVDLIITDADGLTEDATAIINISNTIIVTDNITSNTTWRDGKTYILGGRIAVEAGATLTIEGGAVVKGEAGTGSNATALLVARDATLNANGSETAPIIFTSIADEITPEDVDAGNFASPNLDPDISGLWGGVIVLGNAPISAQNANGDDVTEVQIEGIPSSDSNGLYGGNDATDSSGSITYISIRHGGSNIGEGNEINGLTLGGVGNGTVVENIEVVANQDDGVEWFGGTVNVTNVLVWNSGDDAIDTDQAWAGTLDNVVIVSAYDSSFELDGPEGNYTGSGHSITNATIYHKGNGAEEMIDVDDNTDVNMSNLLFFGLATDENGNAANIISSDYPDYAANTNGYSITNIEAVIPSGLTAADYFTGGLDSEVTEIADISSATVGADVSVFGWTWANVSGALSSIGL
ncbi:hypothetical protein ACKGJO_01945 [Gracilimonas sp. Q87]|uniref:hypothetical protein n=1 Tax=Gracilimonas sp. Q87 TaxID=3384766 RepID=UPI003984433C